MPYGKLSAALIWLLLALVIVIPLAIAASSPLLAARSPEYIIGSMAGIAALAILLIQPLLAAGYLPGLHLFRAKRWHRWIGLGLVSMVLLHVGGLYLTSPPERWTRFCWFPPRRFQSTG